MTSQRQESSDKHQHAYLRTGLLALTSPIIFDGLDVVVSATILGARS
jgi:hypothetical protein